MFIRSQTTETLVSGSIVGMFNRVEIFDYYFSNCVTIIWLN